MKRRAIGLITHLVGGAQARWKGGQATSAKKITASRISDLNRLARSPKFIHRIAFVAIVTFPLWRICPRRSDKSFDLFCGLAKLPAILLHYQCDAVARTAL
jgi:hypothetical protein